MALTADDGTCSIHSPAHLSDVIRRAVLGQSEAEYSAYTVTEWRESNLNKCRRNAEQERRRTACYIL